MGNLGGRQEVVQPVLPPPVPHRERENAETDHEAQAGASIFSNDALNALLIPHIAWEVLDKLPMKDVERCRLVCHDWNLEACQVLRKKRVVIFVERKSVGVYNQAMRGTRDFPHTKYEFCIKDFAHVFNEELKEFWNTFGRHVHSLGLRHEGIFWRDFYRVLSLKAPNLKMLTLSYLPLTTLKGRFRTPDHYIIASVKILRLASLPSDTIEATNRLVDLLSSLPNIEVVETFEIFEAKKICSKVQKSRVGSILLDVLKEPEVRLRKLRRINNSCFELDTDGMRTIISKQLPLQNLNISLKDPVDVALMKNLLYSLRETLRELTISFPNSFPYETQATTNSWVKPEERMIIQLTNLKRLKMEYFHGPLNFIHKLRFLEQLEIVTSNTIQFHFDFSTSIKSALKGLRISSTTSVADSSVTKGISRCFPYLEELGLNGVDDDGLQVIYRNLPSLLTLELPGALCTDVGLTGFNFEPEPGHVAVRAGLRNLRYLRKFSIDGANITDRSLTLGLVECVNLKELSIGSPEVSNTGVNCIVDKFFNQLNMLDISNCTGLTAASRSNACKKYWGRLRFIDAQGVLFVYNPRNRCRGVVKTTRKDVERNDYFIFEEKSDQAFLELSESLLRLRVAMRKNNVFMNLLLLGQMDMSRFKKLVKEFRPEHPSTDLQEKGGKYRSLGQVQVPPIPEIQMWEAMENGEDDAVDLLNQILDDLSSGRTVESELSKLKYGLALDDIAFFLRHQHMFEEVESCKLDEVFHKNLHTRALLNGYRLENEEPRLELPLGFWRQ